MAELRESRYPDRDRNEEGRAENQRPRDRYGAPLPRGAEDELAGRVEPEDVVAGVPDALRRAADLFDQERFFEAHEFLEWIWKCDAVQESDRAFWKGMAQVAVGYCHTQRGNARGAVTLLQRACRAVSPYPDPHGGIAVQRLVADTRAVLEQVERDGASPAVSFPRFPRAADPPGPERDGDQDGDGDQDRDRDQDGDGDQDRDRDQVGDGDQDGDGDRGRDRE